MPGAGTVPAAAAPTRNAFGEAPPSRAAAAAAVVASGIPLSGAVAASLLSLPQATQDLISKDFAEVEAEASVAAAKAKAAAVAEKAAKHSGTWGVVKVTKKEKKKLKHDRFMAYIMPGDTANVVNGVHMPSKKASELSVAKNKLAFTEAFHNALPSAPTFAEAGAAAEAAQAAAPMLQGKSGGAAAAHGKNGGVNSANNKPKTAADVSILTNATRKHAAQDREKFGLVLAHPVFRANPLATIKEHLQNEMALAALQQESLRKLAVPAAQIRSAGAVADADDAGKKKVFKHQLGMNSFTRK